MIRVHYLFAVVTIAVFASSGCTKTADEPAPSKPPAAAKTDDAEEEHGHSHEGDDALAWPQEGIEHNGYTIALGHHGIRVHGGHEVEPAVSIVRDGKAVADAKVYNSLLSADGSEVLAEEVPTVYEPETAEEPAHYAQGGLAVPEGVERITIRFRIDLLDEDEDLSFDVGVTLD